MFLSKIKTILLDKVKEHGNATADELHVLNKFKTDSVAKIKFSHLTDQQLMHELTLLVDGGYLKVNISSSDKKYYYLTVKGERAIGSLWEQAVYFALYDQNNLWAMLALLVSVVALVVSSKS